MKKKHKKVNGYHFPLLWRGLGRGVLILSLTFLNSCIQDIDLSSAGGSEIKIVIEGRIDSGQPAEIFVTRSDLLSSTRDYKKNYFFVIDAKVTISDGTTTEMCTLVSKLDPESAYYAPYKGKVVIGTPGKTYTLTVVAQPDPNVNIYKTYTATTTIPNPVKLDYVWWKAQAPYDTLGYAWAHLSEPAGLGNAYKWYAKRANKWYEKGELKDRRYLAPPGSTFNDQFIDGKSYDLSYARGTDPSDSLTQVTTNGLNTYFKQTDTVYIKFCTIDNSTYKFYSTYEAAYQTNGNPFASPTSIISNINGGGLGIWAGFGCTYDTIYPK